MVSPKPGGTKTNLPPRGYQGPGTRWSKPLPGSPDPRSGKNWRPPSPGRISYRAQDPWDYRPHRWRPRYHHYYYHVVPRYYIFGGWGSGWYDPWWWGNYWWPGYGGYGYPTTHVVYHYYDYDYDPAVDERVYYEQQPWMDAELTTTLSDLAIAWTNGDIELVQAHLTPGVAVAVRHDWEQDDPWVLAAPVLLDIVVEAFDSQLDSRLRFAQIEQMEPGLAWAVAEHSFRVEGEGERQATLEFMFRRYDNTWLIEAIVASPENYWWADSELLEDAERESARLLDEMERAQAENVE